MTAYRMLAVMSVAMADAFRALPEKDRWHYMRAAVDILADPDWSNKERNKIVESALRSFEELYEK